MGKLSEILIYSYLVFLGAFCVFYGVYVVTKSGAYAPPVNINVILPSDIVTADNTIANITQLTNQLLKLNGTSVYGVVIDLWWGLVETEPQQYDWTLYDQLFALLNTTDLKVKVAIAFHACEPTAPCDFSLPTWLDEVDDPDIYYNDRHGNVYTQCLSSGVDYKPIFPPNNRTAVEVYSQFIQRFADHFNQYFDSLIYEVKVGLGPSGELRYPAFPDQYWNFPGIGEFTCYDKYLRSEYEFYATKAGHPEWAHFPNDTAGSYNSAPKDTMFFTPAKGSSLYNYESGYGQFFLTWYSERLVTHGQAILGNAVAIVNGYSPNVTVAAQLGCVFWQFLEAHAAELTAGYKNDNSTGYNSFAHMFAAMDVIFDFGCFEMSDHQFSSNSSSAPDELVFQTLQAAQTYGGKYEGQNTNPVYTSGGYGEIERNCRRDVAPLVGFDLRDLDDELVFDTANFNQFISFVSRMEHPGRKTQ